MPGWQHINCMCRANGQRYHVGERVCLSTPAGLRIAECRMSQNVTNWAVQSEGCDVSAGLPQPPAARILAECAQATLALGPLGGYLDLDPHPWVHQAGDQHGGSRADGAEPAAQHGPAGGKSAASGRM